MTAVARSLLALSLVAGVAGCAPGSLPGAGSPVAASPDRPNAPTADRTGAAEGRKRAKRPSEGTVTRPAPPRAVTSVYRLSPILTWGEHAISHPAAPTVRSLQDPGMVRCHLEQGMHAFLTGTGEAMYSFPFELWKGFARVNAGLSGQPVDAVRALTTMSAQEFAQHMMRNVAVMSPTGGCGVRFAAYLRGGFTDQPNVQLNLR